ncbi:LuxR C-terminal-related transcriptional regulator [Pseudonocardia kujensis]|uniref:helix-turn-helix transcriptional regulator n=1 Tax=Pseudonocardia kujensis TaxID=1128675 RepID=UPI001E502C1D|nr:LuxR C-terminal-related transcriptional regulator [Pseudonocardia kujensis]MCE0761977.1 LuxR C-terminal-related transcriptional regulator [Pseudonocardia kujensis]
MVQDLVDDLSGGDPEPEALLARTHTTLAEIADVARRHDDPLLVCPMAETLHAAVESLTVGERYLRRRLGLADGSGATADTADLLLLLEAQELRLSIGELRVRRRASLAAELHRSLTRLRAGLDTTALLREVPRELGRLGYSRSLMSGVRGTTWRATSAFAHQDESLAGALVQVGSSMPGRIGREEPETEAVRGRTAVLVRDAQSQPRVHRQLVILGDTRDYAAAPVVVHGGVVGLLHVDRHSQADAVDEGDRDLLGLFADGVGLALERARYQERIGALRRQFELQISGIDELTYGTSGWDELVERPTSHPYLSDGPLNELTRRELEVLRHLAGGASNQDIADRLQLSVGTVKTHVKGLLRKLGAANRADAAARFHALTKG